MKLAWYAQRLRRMSAAEVAARVKTAARQRYWANLARRPDPARSLRGGERSAMVALPRSAAPTGPAADAVIKAADELLAGRWKVFHLHPATVGTPPDWFRDPLTGRTAPHDTYTFAVPYRDEAVVGNIKFVWEMSRHQATTLLACAWWLTGRDAYAEGVATQLKDWWAANPFLSGVHWVSAIEVGLRLLSWTWIRALLADWPGAAALFDRNPTFAGQLYHHLLYARTFHSQGSSANNHLVAELAGVAAAASAFPWFTHSAEWARWAAHGLAEQAVAQTHEDGLNREQASEYHAFVLEMMLAASLPARLAGQPFPAEFNRQLLHMADALAATMDEHAHPARYGDGDEGRGMLLDAPDAPHAPIVLDMAAALGGRAPWWPQDSGSIAGHIARLIAGDTPPRQDAPPRPDHFPGAGLTLLRTGDLWLRCDAGPHGFLSIAAHGHADALSIELRHRGIEVLADPGTYCYHGEPAWRGYFKGTIGHNTLTVDGVDQAVAAGPFLWQSQPTTTLEEAVTTGPTLSWQASHDGYRRLPDPATHHRRVTLTAGEMVVEDWLTAAAPHAVTLAYHCGPEVEVQLEGTQAKLRWPGGAATLELPSGLAWRTARGEQDPPFGWYSPGFGAKQPATALAGTGQLAPATRLRTRFILTEEG